MLTQVVTPLLLNTDVTLGALASCTAVIVAWIQFGVRRDIKTTAVDKHLGATVDKLAETTGELLEEMLVLRSKIGELEKKLLLIEIYCDTKRGHSDDSK